ncbi:unnamed protein product, partial [Urochloa humidicola]
RRILLLLDAAAIATFSWPLAGQIWVARAGTRLLAVECLADPPNPSSSSTDLAGALLTSVASPRRCPPSLHLLLAVEEEKGATTRGSLSPIPSAPSCRRRPPPPPALSLSLSALARRPAPSAPGSHHPACGRHHSCVSGTTGAPATRH